MTGPTSGALFAALLLLVSGALSATLALQEQQLESASATPQPDSSKGAPQDKAVWPMVEVDQAQNKSTVDVHVPIFFDMTNHKDAESGRAKLDLSVLQGLVTVNKDRARDQSGQLTGPMKVTVFGIPVYQSKLRQQPGESAESSLSQLRSASQDHVQGVSNQVLRTNGELKSGLSDLLGRLSSMVRQASQAIVAQPSGDYQQPERELRQQQLHPLPYEQQKRQPSPELAELEKRLESNQIERAPARSAREELPKP